MGNRGSLLPVDLNIIGVDISKDACATAEAAGYRRVNTSIRALHPTQYPNLTGLISSTPCPTLSASGLRSSVKTADCQIALDSITSFGTGCGCDWESLPERSTDVRTALAVETAPLVVDAAQPAVASSPNKSPPRNTSSKTLPQN